jgi:tRNA uridine 5-carboxymethylaminomethyl modification enzyme
MEFVAGKYDVLVIGAGHAGCEAALAAARLGASTVIFTINMDAVGNLPCNPSIGGTAKGHIVMEIDALGGEMGKAADHATIQSRMLNRGKGPAVHSLRAQIDRRRYSEYMKHALELQENLHLKQAEIVKIEKKDDFWESTTKLGAKYISKTVIIATGTYLAGKVYVGDVSYESGPDGMFAATELGKCLKEIGLPTRRFKTGTPPRVLKSSINFEGLEEQIGDEPITPFSFYSDEEPQNLVKCHISWTNEKTKEVILNNLDRSPLYSGKIDGVGPRYCPSIEDKIVRFSEKERHQLFIEPCGLSTEEMYLQGMSSSLPEDVQVKMFKTIKGLENLEIMRNAYAIEYDCVDPTVLKPTLECQDYDGLFGAGQFNGSSGYEEAAGQGLIAGINAAHKVLGKDPFILKRSEAYLGTLIDDLVTKGCQDPYRMMTSRSEYRLVLRQDNTMDRLADKGHDLGLLKEEVYNKYLEWKVAKEKELKRLQNTILPPSEELNNMLVSCETSPIVTGIKMIDLMKRPQIGYKELEPFDNDRPQLSPRLLEHIEIEIKYEGYIRRQKAEINEQKRLENKQIPEDLDYNDVTGLRLEAIEKLSKIKPMSVGQASRISGVSPADITVLMIYLTKSGK